MIHWMSSEEPETRWLTREKLINELHITIGEPIHSMYEKLFCAALIKQGTDVAQAVLAEYSRLKKILRGGDMNGRD